MVKKSELKESERLRIIELRAKGVKLETIATMVKRSLSTVEYTSRRYKKYETIQNLPKSGRKKKRTERLDRRIVRIVKIDNSISAQTVKEMLSKENVDLSTSTIKKVLNDHGLNGRTRRKVPNISERNRKKRLDYAMTYRGQGKKFWGKCNFSDESKFELFGKKRRQKVWRRSGEAFESGNTQPTVKHSGSVMVWGCFSANGVGNLVFIDGTMDRYVYRDILNNNLIQSADKMGLKKRFIFQHDNDPKHTSGVVQQALVDMNVQVLPHPPQSPDLNPIEHLWEHLDRQITFEDRSSLDDFKSALLREWNSIPVEVCQKLVYSMDNRLEAVISSRGRATRY